MYNNFVGEWKDKAKQRRRPVFTENRVYRGCQNHKHTPSEVTTDCWWLWEKFPQTQQERLHSHFSSCCFVHFISSFSVVHFYYY
jgi:hypothetical protein